MGRDSSAALLRRSDHIQSLADERGDGVIATQADVTDRDSLVPAARIQQELASADILIKAGVMLFVPFWLRSARRVPAHGRDHLLGALTATDVFLDRLRDAAATW